jgi:replication factor C small subunit
MAEHSLWVEKYRPTRLENYVGNEHLKAKVERYIKSNDVPHLLLFGRAGTGKTTLAKLIVKNIECDYLYINASDENSVDTVRNKVRQFASTIGFKDMKVIVLDECDYITPNAQAALRNLILTCNFVERIIDPIQSRCQVFEIIPPSKKDVALHLTKVMDKEKTTYDNEDLKVLIDSSYPDVRKIINATQRSIVDNKVVMDRQATIQNDYKLKVLDILKTQDKKTAFANLRQLLADNAIRDYSDCFRLLYDNVDEFAEGNMAAVILILARYEQSDMQVVDKEINFMAMLIELLGVIK